MAYQSDEDRDFIVDDGYKHDEDPTYVPEKEESSPIPSSQSWIMV